MKKKSLYYEKQKFTQWWLWLLLVGINLLVVYSFYNKSQEGEYPQELFLLYLGFTATILLLFYCMTLETTINNEGVTVLFFPFHWKKRNYPFSEIKHLEVIKYNPIGDYGGWGVRYGREGKAFNVRGEYGLKLYFSKRKPLLIGTQKPEELKKILEPLFTTK